MSRDKILMQWQIRQTSMIQSYTLACVMTAGNERGLRCGPELIPGSCCPPHVGIPVCGTQVDHNRTLTQAAADMEGTLWCVQRVPSR